MSNTEYSFDKDYKNRIINFNAPTNIGHLHIGDVNYNYLTNEDPFEKISIILIEIDYQKIDEALQKIVTILSLKLSEGEDKIQFVEPKDFEVLKYNNFYYMVLMDVEKHVVFMKYWTKK